MTLAHTGRDAALAVVLAAAGVAEVVTGNDVGPRPVAALAVLAMTLPVAARARAPLAALGVAVTAGLLQALAGGSLSQSVAAFVAVLVLVYSVSSLRAGRVAAAGLAVALVGGWCQTLIETRTGAMAHEPGDYVFVALLIGAAWLGGYALRGRAHRIAGLEHETVRLAREREERAAAAVAEERARIARDLHDVVAHGVSVMVVQAAAAEEVLARDPERARAPLVAIQDTGAQALTEMRRLLGMLRADDVAARAAQPGLAGLDALADEFRHAGLPLESTSRTGARRSRRVSTWPPTGSSQEALTNALKHAGGASSRVSIRHTARRARTRGQRRRGRRPTRRGARPRPDRHARARRAATAARSRPGRAPAAGSRSARCRSPTPMIRVLIADDQALLRGGFRMLLEAQDDLEVVGEAGDGAEALELARRLRPDVVLMDIRMPGMDGLEATDVCSPAARTLARVLDPHHVRPRRVRVRRNAQRARAASCSRTSVRTSSPTRSGPSPPARRCSPRRSRSGSSRSSSPPAAGTPRRPRSPS